MAHLELSCGVGVFEEDAEALEDVGAAARDLGRDVAGLRKALERAFELGLRKAAVQVYLAPDWFQG